MTPSVPQCRHCSQPLDLVFADLGATPISNAFLSAGQVSGPETYYPLRALVCRNCWLVQLQSFFTGADLFGADYVYYSSCSKSWLAHCERYAAEMIARYGLEKGARIVEIASNDGYLLQFFKARGMDVLGVEPSRLVAEAAQRDHGIPTIVRFFGTATAEVLVAEGARRAELMAANNVLAHVPDINDFVAGFRILLAPQGVATFEFPHLLKLIYETEFDTIYHEHFSYLSLLAAERIFDTAGLRVFDVERLPTHGGSLRLHVCHRDALYQEQQGLHEVREMEAEAGLRRPEVYQAFEARVRETKRALLELMIRLKRQGALIVAYGAAAKGNTLLNYCGIGSDMIEFAVDISPHKQGHFLPGTRLPVYPPEKIDEVKPDYVLILPWNLKEEIIGQLNGARSWGCRFILPIPTPRLVE